MKAPLEKRIYKFKRPVTRFFCPLCRTERAFTVRPVLSKKNYLQVIISGIFLGLVFYPSMGPRSFFWPFIAWAALEFGLRYAFKKQVPCPHCGFDATWYKRDVRVARAKVKDFWQTASKN